MVLLHYLSYPNDHDFIYFFVLGRPEWQGRVRRSPEILERCNCTSFYIIPALYSFPSSESLLLTNVFYTI